MEWEFDGRASTTFPLYSRAVVGDLFPRPLTPLSATAGVGAEVGPAWSHVYATLGLMPGPLPASEVDPGAPAVAVFGAQLYLNTSLLRLFAAAAGGADPQAWVRQYLGDGPAVPRQRTEADLPGPVPEQLGRWTRQVLDGDPADRAATDRLARRVERLRLARPELRTCPAADLAARITAARGELRLGLRLHARAELATALVSELLTRTAEEAGHPSRSGDLVAGHGFGGGSGDAPDDGPADRGAGPAAALWRLGRRIRDSDRLWRLFDQGVPHVAGELAGSGLHSDLDRLRADLTRLLADYGHHGPGNWELGARVWAGEPMLPLTLLEVLRHCPDDLDPAVRIGRRAATTSAAVAAVRASLAGAPPASARFDAALEAAPRWLRARRRLVDLVSAVVHEQRLAARELGRRQVEADRLDCADQVFMLLAGELEEFAGEPERLVESLRMRAYDYHALGTYRPPSVTLGQPPPAVRWPRTANGGHGSALTRRGITGTAAAPGAAAGPARVIGSPGTVGLRPGEVLVVPSAGLEWLPLLVGAGAVVVDTGGPLSEVAVAARDLGLPCVVGCSDATQRVATGQEVSVDGWRGTVRPARTGADGADAAIRAGERSVGAGSPRPR